MKKPTILIDSREQTPWIFPVKYEVEVVGLPAGDYSLKGHEPIKDEDGTWNYSNSILIERKSLDDWVNTVFHNSDRFQAEIDKLVQCDEAYILIEANANDILNGEYFSQVKPQSVVGKLRTICKHVPTILCGNRRTATKIAEWTLVYYPDRLKRKKRRMENEPEAEGICKK